MKVVHHIDGNPRNNEIDNLEIVDMKENARRKHAEVRSIIDRARFWEPIMQDADHYNVSADHLADELIEYFNRSN